MEKSLTSIIVEAKQEIAAIINNSKLEPIIWQYILKDLFDEVVVLTNKQIQTEAQDKKEDTE